MDTLKVVEPGKRNLHGQAKMGFYHEMDRQRDELIDDEVIDELNTVDGNMLMGFHFPRLGYLSDEMMCFYQGKAIQPLELPDVVLEMYLLGDIELSPNDRFAALGHPDLGVKYIKRCNYPDRFRTNDLKLDFTVDQSGSKLEDLLSILSFEPETNLKIIVDENSLKSCSVFWEWLEISGHKVDQFHIQFLCKIQRFRYAIPLFLKHMPNLSHFTILPKCGAKTFVTESLPYVTQEWKSVLCPKLTKVFIYLEYLMNESFLYWMHCLARNELVTVGVGCSERNIPTIAHEFYRREFGLVLKSLDIFNTLDVVKLQPPKPSMSALMMYREHGFAIPPLYTSVRNASDESMKKKCKK